MDTQLKKPTKDYKSLSISDFLEAKLNGYLDKLLKLQKADLHKSIIKEVESSLISIVLKKCDYNQSKASKILGINRSTLSSKIKEYNIQVKA